MGNSLNTAEIDAIIAQILDAELKGSDLSLRRLAEVSGVKLTRLGDVLRRGRAITTGELESIARALGLTPWKVLKEAEEAASTLAVKEPASPSEGVEVSSPPLSVIEGGRGVIPEPPMPDFSQLAARTVTSRPEWDAAQQDGHAD